MRRIRLALAAPALAGVALLGLRLASAKDEPPAGGMMPQQPIKHAFADCLLGSWTTESKGKFGPGKGKVTFATGVGGTAPLETYENTGAMGPFHGHAIYKFSDDGKTLSCWWIDSMSAEPMKITGPVSDKGCEISSDTPKGKFVIKMEKTATGVSFKMSMAGEETMSEEYKAAPK